MPSSGDEARIYTVDIEAGVPHPFSPAGEQTGQLRNCRHAISALAKPGSEAFYVRSEPTQSVSDTLLFLALVFRHHDSFGFG